MIRLIGGAVLFVVLAANAPSWMMLLLWAAFAAPLLGLVAHLRGRRW